MAWTGDSRWAVRLAVLCGAAMGCDPFHVEFDDLEDAQVYQAGETSDPAAAGDTLKIMLWNVKFGGGRIDFFFDCHGDAVLMTRAQCIANLEGLAEKIRHEAPDVLLLQEVDVNSKRCDFVNQVQWLLDHTALNHGVYASQWRADFVPSDGLGAIDDGNAILSVWPIDQAERIALALRDDQDSLTRYFYLRRNILRARVRVDGDGDLRVLNVHTAAYARDGTKKKHIDSFTEMLQGLEADGQAFVAGGDLNTVPPATERLSEYPDSVCTGTYLADDYTEEVEWLLPLYDSFDAAIDLELYQASEDDYYSHTTDKDGFWNRKLDYLFTNRSFRAGTGKVHQDDQGGGPLTMPLSDHAPMTVEFEWPP